MTDTPRCRILIVEDAAIIAILVEDMVLHFGSEVVGPAAKIDEAHRPCFGVAGCRSSLRPVMERAGSRLVSRTPPLTKPFSYEVLAEALRPVLANQPRHTVAA